MGNSPPWATCSSGACTQSLGTLAPGSQTWVASGSQAGDRKGLPGDFQPAPLHARWAEARPSHRHPGDRSQVGTQLGCEGFGAGLLAGRRDGAPHLGTLVRGEEQGLGWGPHPSRIHGVSELTHWGLSLFTCQPHPVSHIDSHRHQGNRSRRAPRPCANSNSTFPSLRFSPPARRANDTLPRQATGRI